MAKLPPKQYVNDYRPPVSAAARRAWIGPLLCGLDAVLGSVQATPAKQLSPPGRVVQGGRRYAVRILVSSGSDGTTTRDVPGLHPPLSDG